MVALFPKTQNVRKDELGTESLNEKNLVCRAIKEIKKIGNIKSFGLKVFS